MENKRRANRCREPGAINPSRTSRNSTGLTIVAIEIEPVSKSPVRKEELVARVLAGRGEAPGGGHVLSRVPT
jgi:hypothetical protein